MRSKHRQTSASVVSLFEKMIGEFGFHAYIMAGIPSFGQSLGQVTLANGWPAEWFDLYNRGNLATRRSDSATLPADPEPLPLDGGAV